MNSDFEIIEPPPTGAAPAETDGDEQETIFEGIVKIDLPAFKGPIDVLCYLLRRGDIDTRAVPPVEVAQQVLNAMPMLAGRDIIGAGSSLYYDALLLEVKSALLSEIGLPDVTMAEPAVGATDEVARTGDGFAQFLARRYREWRDTATRGDGAGERRVAPSHLTSETMTMLPQIFCGILARTPPLIHRLPQRDEPIADRKSELIARLPLHRPVALRVLWRGEPIIAKVLLFLAVLELATQQIIVVEQSAVDGDIFLTRIRTPLQLADDEPAELALPFAVESTSSLD